MYKQFKNIFFLTIPIYLLIIQTGCKKDSLPSQTLPQITQVIPAAAMVGTPVLIKGVNLKDVNAVRFGATDAVGFSAGSNTDTTVMATVPAGLNPGEVYVQVYYADGTGYAAMKFTVIETPRKPTITSISPKTGFPDDEVIFNGVDMADVTEVKFGTVTTNYTATATKITTKVPLNATGGDQVITIKNPVGIATVNFNVNLSPVITGLNPGSGRPGDSVVVTANRFTNILTVKVGSIAAGFRVMNETSLKFEVPATATTNKVTITNAIGSATSANPFEVKGLTEVLEPVTNANLVFFDFNGTGNKDLWWGDVGGIENNASLAIQGSGSYFRVNTNNTAITDWHGFFWRNGANNFPGITIGTDISNYVLKFDIYVIDPITGGEFAWRLKGTEGDFFYSWKPWAATGTFRTFGWKTYSIPLADFADGVKHITDLSKITEDFGVAFNNGTAKLNVAIDNVRFEHK